MEGRGGEWRGRDDCYTYRNGTPIFNSNHVTYYVITCKSAFEWVYAEQCYVIITFDVSGTLESISKPRLSTGSEFFIFNRFPRGHYLVWLVRVRVRVRVSLGVKVRVSVEVKVRVRVSNLLGSG